MKVLELLDEFESRLEISSSIPFSGKILVDRGEVSNLLKEIQLLLPDEIKHAKWIRDDRNNIIEEAKKDAEMIVSQAQSKEQEILKNAQDQFDDMLDRHKLVEAARQKSELIMAKARSEADEIKQNALQYSMDIIEKAFHNMDEITQLLDKNRLELQSFIKSEENHEN